MKEIYLEIQCGRVKNYSRERGIQLSDGGIGNKSKTVRFKQGSCSDEAGPTSLFCQRLLLEETLQNK